MTVAESWRDGKRSQIGANVKDRGSRSWDLQVRSEPAHGQKEKTKFPNKNQTGESKGSWNGDRWLGAGCCHIQDSSRMK